MRILLALTAGLFVSGCLATSGDVRKITSDPPGALVTVQGYGECETPCKVRLDDHRNVTVAKAGYKAKRFVMGPSGPPLKVRLELAAASDDVDAETLPDLD